MSQAAYRKKKRDELKKAGYKLLPERWVLAHKMPSILKYMKRKGAIKTIGDIDE